MREGRSDRSPTPVNGPMTVTCHLNVLGTDAKTPNDLANLVDGQRGMKRLPKQLLRRSCLVPHMQRHQSLDLLLILWTGQVTQEQPTAVAQQSVARS